MATSSCFELPDRRHDSSSSGMPRSTGSRKPIQSLIALFTALVVFSQPCEARRSLNQGASQGQFGPVIEFPLVATASAVLPSGQILTWSGAVVNHYAGGVSGDTYYAIFDPDTDTVGGVTVVNNAHDMFCPGIAMLPNGNVAVVGGSSGGDGAGALSIWTGSEFIAGPALNTPRAYSSALTLSSGRIWTLGGSFNAANREEVKGAEVYNPNTDTWRPNPTIDGDVILSDDPQGRYRQDNYGFFFAWSSNSVFHAGPSTQMNWFDDLAGDGSSTAAGTRGPTAMNGNAVMFAAGQILTVGGAPSFSQGDAARNGAEVIGLGSAGDTPTVRAVSGPNSPRTYAMAVVLPTGQVAHIGGAAVAVEFSDETAILETELWDPDTEEWTVDASAAVPRTYHSSAVLVPDGRVFVGGGGLCGACGVNHQDAEMYSPPYLFNADGSTAARPTISLGTSSADNKDIISVTASEPLSMVSMIRMGGSTHSANTDQRRVEFCGPSTNACSGDDVMVTIPAKGVAIPGYWMVFGINEAGVPSVAATLQVT